jgi:hypothetical protein
MTTTRFEVLSTTFTCEPFIDEDGAPMVRFGMYGDHDELSVRTLNTNDLVRVCKTCSDTGARMEAFIELADQLVDEGTWTVHKRDAYLTEKCRALVTRLDVSRRPASPV